MMSSTTVLVSFNVDDVKISKQVYELARFLALTPVDCRNRRRSK